MTPEDIGAALMRIEAVLGSINNFFKLHHWALIALLCVVFWISGHFHFPF